jgi:predicted metalloprotease with PDZ domain
VTGEDWKTFYADHIRGVKELPYQQVFEGVGLAPAIVVTDSPDLGLDLRGTYVMFVTLGSEAEKAGIKQGDRIAAVNDVEVTRSTLREVLTKLVPGEDAKLGLIRGEGKMDVTVKPSLRQRTSCKLRRAENPTDLQKRILDSWLGKPRNY